MTNVFENSDRFLDRAFVVDDLWLSKTTDWFKLLQLPNVSWLQFLVATVSLVVVVWGIVRLVSRVNEDVDPAEADREMLQALLDLRRGGDLTEDEFRLIKRQITTRLSTTWKAHGKSENPVRNTGETAAEKLKRLTSELNPLRDSDSAEKRPEASQSDESETFASPTNLPEPSQNTEHLAERSMARETEKGEGTMEAGSENDNRAASQEDV